MRASSLHAHTPRGRLATPRAASPLLDATRGKVLTALRACFNFLSLNLVLVVACLPVVTLPLAFQAAAVALDRWRVDCEDRVVREFLSALRSSPRLATTIKVGTPLAVAALAAEEVHFFAHGGTAVDWVSLGFGVAALLLALTSIGYVLLLGARRPLMGTTDVWYLSVRLAVRNLPLTGPLFVAELVATALALLLDPALGLIGLPLALLCLLRGTAELGMRRIGLGAGDQGEARCTDVVEMTRREPVRRG